VAAKKKATKIKTKYVYCPECWRYEIVKVIKPRVHETILICREVESEDIYVFNLENDEVYPESLKVRKLMDEKSKLSERIGEINRELSKTWIDFCDNLLKTRVTKF